MSTDTSRVAVLPGTKPKAGDIVERRHDPGIACIVDAVVGDFVEFTVLQGEDRGRHRIVGTRAINILVPAPTGSGAL